MPYGEIAAQAGSNLLGAGVSYLLNSKLGEQAREENYYYNERAASNADQRTRALWADQYSIKAQMQDLKAAGLSPSMFYQGNGPIGQSGAMSAGAGGVQNGYVNVAPMDIAGIKLADAQAELVKAQKNNINEDTITKQLNNYVLRNTTGDQIQQIQTQTEVMAAQLQNIITQTKDIQWHVDFNTLTKNEQVLALQRKNSELLSQVLLNEANANLSDRQREHFDTIFDKWQMDVYQKFVELDISQESVDNQNEWFDDQVYNFRSQLSWDKEKFPKELKLNKTRTWLTFGSDVLKTAVYGFGLYATGGLSGLTGGGLSTTMGNYTFNSTK